MNYTNTDKTISAAASFINTVAKMSDWNHFRVLRFIAILLIIVGIFLLVIFWATNHLLLSYFK